MDEFTVIREDLRIQNNLESFLRDIYRNELKYKIGRNEVKFIQRGIEDLVETIVNVIEIEAKEEIGQIKKEYQQAFPSLVLLPNADKVVGIGSFYDKTKNGYPNEFDFNYVLFTFSSDQLTQTTYATFGYTHDPSFKKVHRTVKYVLCRKSLREKLVYERNGRVIQFEKYDEQIGPTSRLLFSYHTDNSVRTINVDLILAVRRVDEELWDKKLHPVSEFMENIALTGGVFYVNDKMTFPETEVAVMRYVVSHKHRKACRILKYLMNGHKDGEILAKRLRQTGLFNEIISSNRIKTEIILHHFKCQRTDRYLFPCVLKILDSINNDYDADTPLDTLTAENEHVHLFRSVDRMRYLQKMISTLTAMSYSTKPYVYEKDRITPIARSLLVYPKPVVVQYTHSNVLDGVWCLGSYFYHVTLMAFSVLMVVLFLMVLIYSLR